MFRPEDFAELTTPSAALRWLRNFLLMPQPPLLAKEGNAPALKHSVNSFPRFPSLQRRGGRAIKKMTPFRIGADGVVRPAKCLGLKSFAELTTPSARSKVASRYFLDRASTPPFQGGE